MARRFAHYLQTFSYTRLDDDEYSLRPFVLKISEETAFAIVKNFVSKKEGILEAKYEFEHHEIFQRFDKFEVNYLFASDDIKHTVLSMSTYAHKKGISYKKLLELLKEIEPVVARYKES